ncbi:MAG: hypothetical protein ACRDA3_06055 [Peptostreptococcaceae bacterium]
MNEIHKIIINEYKNYLIRNSNNSIEINNKIKTIEDIKQYSNEAKSEFEKLKLSNLKYKLYDKDYELFRIAMGKLALGITKSYKLQINDKDKKKLTCQLTSLHIEFKDLFQSNIIKDVYVWI